MSDPIASAHFAKIASRVNGPAAEGLVQYGRIYGHLCPENPSAFFFYKLKLWSQ